ncbi:G patch domain-containing protein 11 [Orussus abietinus]|uniref:G patch domain-containing protein 11 n=1 Tax=Orussus abietinus TaxID=222816 RepID=UPI00062592BB|nr:G patch domain-containing protein 11 [Orussus abietinus]
MSDDDDYMSDKFLQGMEKCVAPSLVHRHTDKRQIEMMKKKVKLEAQMREKNKPVRVIEEEKREEGLSSAISSDNKGFAMLMKMGYKPGQGIGKTESGISEPIPVDVKANRLGLGKAVKKTKKCRNPDEKLNNLNMDDFRVRMAQRKAEHLIEGDLSKSQRVCERLDTCNKMEEPHELWFWPTKEKPKNEDDSSSDSEEEEEEEEIEALPSTEKLEILTKYLRDRYFYCIWCGTAFDDQDDLKENCPGGTRNDH